MPNLVNNLVIFVIFLRFVVFMSQNLCLFLVIFLNLCLNYLVFITFLFSNFMATYNLFFRKITRLFLLLTFLVTLNQCGIYRKTDARKISPNAKERVKQNMEQGRRIKFGNFSGGSGSFDFASSNEMWRASIEILDFIPLSSADYGGGIIITDWYNEGDENSSVKIMVRFLSNEIRADGIKIKVFSKNCKPSIDCPTTNDDELSNEIKLAILKQASIYKNKTIQKEAEELRKRGAFNNPSLKN